MAFTPEDGSGVTDANSYVTLAEANAYHSDRGNAGWTGADAVKQSALIRATDYVNQVYDGRWQGQRVDVDQSLDWPRYDVCGVSSDTIPKQLKQAVCALALTALSADLNPDLERGGAIKREKVDVIEVEYMDGASGRTARPAVDGLLSRLLESTGFNAKVVRV